MSETISDDAARYLTDLEIRHHNARRLVMHLRDLERAHLAQWGSDPAGDAILGKLHRDRRDAEHDAARLEAMLAECR